MSMTGSEFYDYLLKTFLRDDKETEAYEAITDAVSDMANKFSFNELETEMTTTDTISVLGDYKINLESNFGFPTADVVVVDGDSSRQLISLAKDEFDSLYPNPAASNVNKAKPQHYCIYAGQIYLGPVPDSVSYTYRVSYSAILSTAVTSATAAVPFSGLASRKCLRFYALENLYGNLEDDALEAKYKARGDAAFRDLVQKEKRKRKTPIFTACNNV